MVAQRKFRCGACGVVLVKANLCRDCRDLVGRDNTDKILRVAARKDTTRQRRMLIYGARALQRLPLFTPPVE